MNKPLVSVVMPAYNAANYIANAVLSVLSQSYGHIELLIIDDASTDATRQILQPFLSDPRTHYYRLRHRVSVAATRNVGLHRLTGQYVAFIDADDIWLPNKLQRQLQTMLQWHIDFSFGDYELIDQAGKRLQKTIHGPQVVTYHRLLKTNSLPLLTVVLKRQCLHGHDFPDCPDEDYALWLTLLREGQLAERLPLVLAQYRVRPHSVSGNKFKASRWVWQLYRRQEHLSRLAASLDWCCYLAHGVVKHYLASGHRSA